MYLHITPHRLRNCKISSSETKQDSSLSLHHGAFQYSVHIHPIAVLLSFCPILVCYFYQCHAIPMGVCRTFIIIVSPTVRYFSNSRCSRSPWWPGNHYSSFECASRTVAWKQRPMSMRTSTTVHEHNSMCINLEKK